MSFGNVVLLLIGLGLSGLAVTPAAAETPVPLARAALPPALVFEDFLQAEQGGTWPAGWRALKDDREARGVYSLTGRGGHPALRAHARGNAAIIGKEFSFDPHQHPLLNWEWRAIKFPSAGNEAVWERNDSVLGVLVAFRSGLLPIPRFIKYVWSSSLPAGTVVHVSGRMKIVVVESGEARRGEWVEARVNLAEDYRRLYGAAPTRVMAIGLLTDADDTRSEAIGEYGRLLLHQFLPPAAQGSPKPTPLR
ncbi:MAG: DUF3047 domain-containing protein [Deltaproteobacteria bacterium]|nr:DUF3047 domain-containing protein [Deltaproteobacteria bacterium]MBI3076501.1 DUF3047 domain-containing protein [Deltaproteobacteria bacterium]